MKQNFEVGINKAQQATGHRLNRFANSNPAMPSVGSDGGEQKKKAAQKTAQKTWRIVLPKRSAKVCQLVAWSYFRFAFSILAVTLVPGLVFYLAGFHPLVKATFPLPFIVAGMLVIPGLWIAMPNLYRALCFLRGDSWSEILVTPFSLIEYDRLGSYWSRTTMPLSEVADWECGKLVSPASLKRSLLGNALPDQQQFNVISATLVGGRHQEFIAVGYSTHVQQRLQALVQSIATGDNSEAFAELASSKSSDGKQQPWTVVESEPEVGEAEFEQVPEGWQVRLAPIKTYDSSAYRLAIMTILNVVMLGVVSLAWLFSYQHLTNLLFFAGGGFAINLAWTAYNIAIIARPAKLTLDMAIKEKTVEVNGRSFDRAEVLGLVYLRVSESADGLYLRLANGKDHALGLGRSGKLQDWAIDRINQLLEVPSETDDLDWRKYAAKTIEESVVLIEKMSGEGIALLQEGDRYRLSIQGPSLTKVYWQQMTAVYIFAVAILVMGFSTLLSTMGQSVGSIVIICVLLLVGPAIVAAVLLWNLNQIEMCFGYQYLQLNERLLIGQRRHLWKGKIKSIQIRSSFLNQGLYSLEIESAEGLKRISTRLPLPRLGRIVALMNLVVLSERAEGAGVDHC